MKHLNFHFKVNSIYGLLSTKVIHSLPKVVGPAYLPYYPGCVYVGLPAVNDELVWEIIIVHFVETLLQGFTVTYYKSRPDHLVYHSNEHHVFDLKVKYFFFSFLSG